MKGLNELLQMLQAQNIKENLPARGLSRYEYAPGEWINQKKPSIPVYEGKPTTQGFDDEYADRKRERAYQAIVNGADGRFLDPSEEMQPQHMVSPKENMWLEMAKKGMR